jgi:hypothetical protein
VIPSLPPPPPSTVRPLRRGSISPRKLILGIILTGSVLAFFLILSVTAVAILREAAPFGRSGLTPLLVAIKRLIAHHIPRIFDSK